MAPDANPSIRRLLLAHVGSVEGHNLLCPGMIKKTSENDGWVVPAILRMCFSVRHVGTI